jgi:hypothetical protein
MQNIIQEAVVDIDDEFNKVRLSLAVLALVVIFFSQDYLEDPEYWCRLCKLLYDMLGFKP